MEKSRIKYLLRESLSFPMQEAAPAEGEGKKDNAKYEKDYNFVQQKLDGTLLKANQVMAAADLGNPDDATDRSLFSKKLRKEKNEEGGQYLFNDDDLAKIINVINNPISKM